MATVAVPHLGTTWLLAKSLFQSVGFDVVVPPFNSRETFEIGQRHCPETLCSPCKLLFGNYVQALEQGADILVMFGGEDTCRLGYSAQQQQHVLRSLGYSFEAHVFDWYRGYTELVFLPKRLSGASWPTMARALRLALGKQRLAEDLERRVHYLRPRELEAGAATRVFRAALPAIDRTRNMGEVKELRRDLQGQLARVPIQEDRPVLRVGLVGDPYTIGDTFLNMNLEVELGRLGVEVHRWFWITDLTRFDPVNYVDGKRRSRATRAAAHPYLQRNIGAFGRSAVGNAVKFARWGYDGIIHVAPWDCTPEVVADNIMTRVAREEKVPILSLVFDELTSHVGLLTRLEAFTDMLRRKRSAAPRAAGAGRASGPMPHQ